MEKSHSPYDHEPDAHDRAKDLTYPRCTATLHNKKAGEDAGGNRDDVRLEYRRCDFKPFHSAQGGDRGRDDAIAIKKRGSQQAAQNCEFSPPFASERCRRERGQRHDAALAIVCSTHYDKHIFYRYHDNQRPKDERYAAEYDRSKGVHAVGRANRLLESVEWTCSDIAKNDAKGAYQRPHALHFRLRCVC